MKRIVFHSGVMTSDRHILIFQPCGKYIPKSRVDFDSGPKPVERETGLPVVVDWEKMSKSKHNGADPGVVINTYGSDMTR